jgi:hypothetical protein
MNVVVVGNFDVYQGTLIPGFSQTGPWYDFFGGDTLNVTNLTDQISLQPGEYHIYTTVKLPKPLFTGIGEITNSTTQNGRNSTAYPNPSSGAFTIQYSIPNASHIKISVSDIYGRTIAGLFDGMVNEGTYKMAWNGQDNRGQQVSPGIYLYKFEAGEHSEIGKLIVQ